jgi:polyhydroxybutyrate depolymerase
MRMAALLALAGLLATDVAAQQAPGRLAPGDHEIAIAHDGRRRSYIVHVPVASGQAPLPLLVAFHGGGGNASGYQRYAGLDAVADRERFVVVYPNGTGPLRNLLLTFNAGNNCCGPALAQKIDDVGFAAAVVGDVARRVNVDRRRVYATGHSNGAMMAYRLAAERADLVAAIAPVAGAMSLDRFAPSRAVPVLHIHSVDDPRARYEGGVGPPFPGTDNRVDHAPVRGALDKWIAANECPTMATVAESRRGESGTDNAGQTATRLVHAPCRTGADVVHWKLTGVGHGWPGGDSPTPERITGPGTTLLDAAEEVWTFVSRFRR